MQRCYNPFIKKALVMTKKQKRIERLKELFLRQLVNTGGNVLQSCELSGLARNTALRHKAKDAGFREKWGKVAKGELILNEGVSRNGENLTKSYLFDDKNLRNPKITETVLTANSEQPEQPLKRVKFLAERLTFLESQFKPDLMRKYKHFTSAEIRALPRADRLEHFRQRLILDAINLEKEKAQIENEWKEIEAKRIELGTQENSLKTQQDPFDSYSLW